MSTTLLELSVFESVTGTALLLMIFSIVDVCVFVKSSNPEICFVSSSSPEIGVMSVAFTFEINAIVSIITTNIVEKTFFILFPFYNSIVNELFSDLYCLHFTLHVDNKRFDAIFDSVLLYLSDK